MPETKTPSPVTISLETPHYLLRTLEPGDATPAWQEWMTDDVAVRNLNARPATVALDQIRDYIEKHDRTTSHILGMFEKETGRLVGVRVIYVDPAHKEFLVNVLVGEAQARGKGARSETADVIYRYFFEELGLESARCHVLASNEEIIGVMHRRGWSREHVDRVPAASGAGSVERQHFRLTRDAWRAREAKKNS